MVEQWITVTEYAAITGRKKQSVYKSIERGTVDSKVVAGVKMVKVVQPVETDDCFNQNNQPETTETANTTELDTSQTADFIAMLKATIAELHSDKEALKQDKAELKQEKAELLQRVSELNNEVVRLKEIIDSQSVEQSPIEHGCSTENQSESTDDSTKDSTENQSDVEDDKAHEETAEDDAVVVDQTPILEEDTPVVELEEDKQTTVIEVVDSAERGDQTAPSVDQEQEQIVKEEKQTTEAATPKLTRWQHLKAFFTGR